MIDRKVGGVTPGPPVERSRCRKPCIMLSLVFFGKELLDVKSTKHLVFFFKIDTLPKGN